AEAVPPGWLAARCRPLGHGQDGAGLQLRCGDLGPGVIAAHAPVAGGCFREAVDLIAVLEERRVHLFVLPAVEDTCPQSLDTGVDQGTAWRHRGPAHVSLARYA